MTTSTPTPADALIAALHEPGRENLLDLVRNPLRLTLLCMTWDGSSLPETQAELYARYLKEVYQWNQNLQELRHHAQRCGTNITNLKQDLNRQLGELAKAALNLPQERFRLSQALVEEYLGEELDETSLGYLALRLGWLNRVGKDGRGDAIFAFYHATFQQYFAALAVADWDYFLPKDHCDRPVEGKRYRVFEKQWKQVILLWLGRGDIRDEEKETFIGALVEFKDGCGEWNFEEVDRGFYGYQAYFLAAAGINEFKACSLATKIVRQVVKWKFGYFNTNRQEWVAFLELPIEVKTANVLWETNRQLATQEIIAILNYSPDAITLGLAAYYLKKIDPQNPYNRQSITSLIEIIEDSSNNENIRLRTLYRLEEITPHNDQEVISVLTSVITNTKNNEELREAAAIFLMKEGDKGTIISALIQVLNNAENEYPQNSNLTR